MSVKQADYAIVECPQAWPLTNCICEARDLGLVRPLPMTKSTEKFEFEHKHSQRLGA